MSDCLPGRARRLSLFVFLLRRLVRVGPPLCFFSFARVSSSYCYAFSAIASVLLLFALFCCG